MEQIVIDWLTGIVERAPEIAILGFVAWDMRKHLLQCIDHNNTLLDQLITRYLKEQ